MFSTVIIIILPKICQLLLVTSLQKLGCFSSNVIGEASCDVKVVQDDNIRHKIHHVLFSTTSWKLDQLIQVVECSSEDVTDNRNFQ